MEPYLHEWRDRYVGRAACVLRPGSEEEVAGLLRIAGDAGVAIVPQGGNTGLVGGQIPFEEGNEVVLSLDRMNRILRVDPEDDSITLEAGGILRRRRSGGCSRCLSPPRAAAASAETSPPTPAA